MKRASLLVCLEAGESVSQTGADVSVQIPAQCERIARPHHLSLCCALYQTVALVILSFSMKPEHA